MMPIGQPACEDLSWPTPVAPFAGLWCAGPGDDDDDDDEVPIGDPPDDDEDGDFDDEDEDDDEEPLQVAFALQHGDRARIAAQCRPRQAAACADGSCAAAHHAPVLTR